MSFLDRVVKSVAPGLALKREMARQQLRILGTFNSSGAGPGWDTANRGASITRRGMRTWLPSTSRNPDDEIVFERRELLARSRDAFRNDAIARGAVNTMLTSVIGRGLDMHCRIDRQFLGFGSDDEASEWERNTERLFRAWANSTDADARRKNTFYRLQYTAYKSFKTSGEIFALLPLIPRKGTICDLRVQLVEADRVSTPIDMVNGPLANGAGAIWDGIETGKYGEPVAYHVETTIPIPFIEIDRRWSRIQAYGTKSGRRQLIHFYEEDRPGQRRGLPWLSPILEMLKQVSRYTDAELMAAVLSGMFTVFVKHADADSDVLGGLQSSQSTQTPGPFTDQEGGDPIELGNGAIVDLRDGESIETANPGRPNANFGPFTVEIIRQIAMALNIPYEVLVKAFNSSYSASRAAILQAWEVFKTEREWFINEFLQPIYVEFLCEMIATGRIEAPGFFDSVEVQRAYCKTAWYGPSMPQIDPVKEATAAKLRLDQLLSTLAEECERIGGDWEENLAQRKREHDRITELGLVQMTPIPSDQLPIFPE